MRFRPNIQLRFGILLPAALICVPAATVWKPGLALDEQLVFIVIFAVVIPLAVRWVVFSGVSLRENDLTVHGVWWSRRVPRDQTIQVRQKSRLDGPALARPSRPHPAHTDDRLHVRIQRSLMGRKSQHSRSSSGQRLDCR
ncbi:hypothetical protein, partial [Rathayibacter sp. AY1A7]|uniref:hypothetical protein n=1 Tax=Rathayibacter sp. AY1A7 TaxID=2080524 RepID=UPI001CA5997D